MADITAGIGIRSNRRLGEALYRHAAWTADGLSERLFAFLFSGLVYPQIWEDPEVDMQAMRLSEGHRVVTIASGGCNVLAYLTRSPAHIDAVDLNPHHVALNRLKLAALANLPDADAFTRFFSGRAEGGNAAAYDRFVAPCLDAATRRYWGGRDLAGRRRVAVFDRNFYRTGLLGLCIRAGHVAARLHGVNPAEIIEARTLRDQRRFFEDRLRPLFSSPLIRLATRSKASLFGLGIPPAQYDALGAGAPTMAEVLCRRVEKLACDFPLRTNYFAWQAFARRYPQPGEAALPAYLEPANHAVLKANAGRVAVHHKRFDELLAGKPAASVDRFVLLDAQDWMTDAQLDALWRQITRTAAPGARVIFRTADEPSLLPGRVDPTLLAQWRYEDAESRRLSAEDRSAIYGGFHLYARR
jgi:S-adenosylmethionine-diacylglycerol 3-amino-3-carboxypropyl transferase